MTTYAQFPPETVVPRLEREANVWLATVRADSRPHLVPVWFVWHDAHIYLCIQPQSVKAINLQNNPRIALALENGNQPVICEGIADTVPLVWPETVRSLFQQKYNWDIVTDADYGLLLRIRPERWLVWG
ncbi:MAG: pyridoxamine 5'-phosphate oxidase family protein [Chloroflexi bacterium]|nr:pyridoxamine 5'-phosphate oxidase family protein [Chloroflexota bacterium]MBP8059334.1 pyridoxamine 5'-phosphate oxidase family protein [Chloroflexota bacterium]